MVCGAVDSSLPCSLRRGGPQRGVVSFRPCIPWHAYSEATIRKAVTMVQLCILVNRIMALPAVLMKWTGSVARMAGDLLPGARCVSVDHRTVLRWVQRDADAAARFFRQMLQASYALAPRVITVDKNAAYAPAFEALQQEGMLPETCRRRPCPGSATSSLRGLPSGRPSPRPGLSTSHSGWQPTERLPHLSAHPVQFLQLPQKRQSPGS